MQQGKLLRLFKSYFPSLYDHRIAITFNDILAKKDLRLFKSYFPSLYDHRISITFNDNSIERVFLRAHFQKCSALTPTSLSLPETGLKQVMKMTTGPKMRLRNKYLLLAQETSWSETLRGASRFSPLSSFLSPNPSEIL